MRRRISASDNKYSRGIVAVAAGSTKYPGASILAVGGARRGNAGYVKYLSGNVKLRDLVVTQFPDVVPIRSLAKEQCDAFVIGPGSPPLHSIPKSIPVVLDGSAIAILRKPSIRRGISLPIVTPHEGELRYLGVEIETHLKDSKRLEIAADLSKKFGAIIVLKGNRTIICGPDGRSHVDEMGGPELATAGSGDVLAGLIGSMVVATKVGIDPFTLVCDAVQLHSRAGRYAAQEFTAVTAVELLDALAHV